MYAAISNNNSPCYDNSERMKTIKLGSCLALWELSILVYHRMYKIHIRILTDRYNHANKYYCESKAIMVRWLNGAKRIRIKFYRSRENNERKIHNSESCSLPILLPINVPRAFFSINRQKGSIRGPLIN